MGKKLQSWLCKMSILHIRRIDREFHQRRSVYHRRATIRKWGCRPVSDSTLPASFQSVTNISTWKQSTQVAAIIDLLEHSVYLPQHSRPRARRSRPDHTPLNTDCPDSKRNTKLRKSGPQDFDEVRTRKCPATKKRIKTEMLVEKKRRTWFWKSMASTGSTSHVISFPSFEPLANRLPSGEKRQNHTSSSWSLMMWIVLQGKSSLKTSQYYSAYQARNIVPSAEGLAWCKRDRWGVKRYQTVGLRRRWCCEKRTCPFAARTLDPRGFSDDVGAA